MKLTDLLKAATVYPPRPEPSLSTGLFKEFVSESILGVTIESNYALKSNYHDVKTRLSFQDIACTNMRLEIDQGIYSLHFTGISECENLASALEWAAVQLREKIGPAHSEE